ncbi:MAG: flavodoxin family protein [Desulfofustis sp.]|nr:flavodoxin family protein [Desulfofustis sp.]
MKILVILGSPRKNGNSEAAARLICSSLDNTLAETEYVRLVTHKISPCIACGGCEKTGMCIVKDDMIDLYDKIDLADIILLASPTYFYGVSAQLKAFIDRIQARWSRRYLMKVRTRQEDKRLGYLISTAATHGKKLFDGSILVAKSYFDAIDVTYGGAFVVRGVDEKGALQNQPGGIQQAEAFALEILETYQS